MTNQIALGSIKSLDTPPADVQNEFVLFMSMALDNLLEGAEKERFHRHLQTYPVLAQQWRTWQDLDQQLHSAPAMSPPPDFVQNVELRLLQQERRRRLWWGGLVGLAILLLWFFVMAIALSLGAYVAFNQTGWLTTLVRVFAFLSAAVTNWLQTAGSVLGTLLGTQQALSFGIAYGIVAIALLTLWVTFLRRSTRSAEVPTAAL